ncbi:uncharacterized protein [Gossypium hirsutum]|uniref:Glutamic acid-rich protein-like n=1 Tax=Gossypium hirsutum TaxID=3635 RepID=A0A1U8KNA9_GOSHI|nr:uncharacterized protein LOC107917357 [Gossypium hirsutum]
MLNSHTRNLVYASANGPLLDCTFDDVIRILERIAQNDYQYPIPRAAQAKATLRVIELDSISALNAQHMTHTEAIVQGNSSSIQALEEQLGQLASNLKTRPLVTLPSDMENPSSRGKEHCKAITLRSGKQTGEPTTDCVVAPQDTSKVIPAKRDRALRDDEEVLENKDPINEASIKRMTRGKDIPTMKEAETNKTKKGKTKAETKGMNLIIEISLLHKMKDIEKLANSISNNQIMLVTTIEDMDRSQNFFYAYTKAYNNSIVAILCQLCLTPLLKFQVFPPIIQEYEPSSKEDNLGDQDRSVASPFIVHTSDVKKEEGSMNVEECMRWIDSLVEGDFITGQEAPAVEEEVTVEEEDVCVEVVNKKAEEENTKTEATKKESVEDIVNASEFVGATTNNLERDGARPAEATEVTTDNAEAMPETEEKSEDRAKPKKKKRKYSKDKKLKKKEKKRRKKKHHATTLMADEY